MTNYIKQWWEQSKAKSQAEKVSELRSSFYLKERNGSVWIMHDGVAVNQLPPFASTEEIVAILEETRACAVEYAIGEPKNKRKAEKTESGDSFSKGDNLDPNFFVDL